MSWLLDAQEQLREPSQGQSFFAFWTSCSRLNAAGNSVELAYALPILADEGSGSLFDLSYTDAVDGMPLIGPMLPGLLNNCFIW